MLKNLLALLIPFMLVDCCMVRDAHGQIRLEPEPKEYWTGFKNPKIVDGVLVCDPSTPAKKVEVSQLLVLDDGFKLTDIEIEKKPDFDFVQPTLTPRDDGKIEMRIGATGSFRARAELEVGGKRVIQRFNFVLDAQPDPQPGPIDDGGLSVLSKESRKAMADYVASMARDMEALSANAQKYKTVNEASTAANSLDAESRASFKQAIARVMQPRLGSDALPADAAETFKQIAAGYRSLK